MRKFVLDSDAVLAEAYPTLPIAEARAIHEMATLVKLIGVVKREWCKARGPAKHSLAREWGEMDTRISQCMAVLGARPRHTHSLQESLLAIA